ncbi:MAG TPA: adenylate kinase family protein [Methanoregulaceae archaeon]|nr:adenylate kinase family protein [Methanoregulaceae archaeon]
MMCGITGTPGTGKSSVAEELACRGYRAVHLSDTTTGFVLEKDEGRDTLVIDEEAWISSFTPVEGVVEGHLAHLLPCEIVIILRCRPDELSRRLSARGYNEMKIRENYEAEALDVILIETLEIHPADHIYEIDTTFRTVSECACLVEQFIKGELPPTYGSIDWSAYLEAC